MGSKFVALWLCAAAGASAVEIPKGAHVLLRMVNSVSTRSASEGDYVYLETASPIVVAGTIAAPTGSYVQGVVTHVKRSGRVAGRAEIAIRLETLTLPGGRSARFNPHVTSVDDNDTDQKIAGGENVIQQGGSKARDAALIAIFAGSGASIGGIADRSVRGAGIGAGAGSAVGLATVLASRGKEAELRRGSTLDVAFDRAVTLE